MYKFYTIAGNYQQLHKPFWVVRIKLSVANLTLIWQMEGQGKHEHKSGENALSILQGISHSEIPHYWYKVNSLHV